jgi:hypothetical protein
MAVPLCPPSVAVMVAVASPEVPTTARAPALTVTTLGALLVQVAVVVSVVAVPPTVVAEDARV